MTSTGSSDAALVLLVLGAGVLLGGLPVLLVGLRLSGRQRARRRTWVEVPGVVVRAAGVLQRPRVEYPLPDGTPHAFEPYPLKGEVFRLGDAVRVLADPADPRTGARVLSGSRTVGRVLLVVVGAVLSSTGCATLLGGLATLLG